MPVYLIAVFAHIVLGIVLVGYGLFWLILSVGARGGGTGASGEAAPSDEAHRTLLDAVRRTLWPPKGLPVPVRFPLWALGLVLLVAVVLSGGFILGWDAVWATVRADGVGWLSLPTKLIAVAFAGLLLVLAALRPRPWVMRLLFLTLLGVVALSSLLTRVGG